MTILAMTDKPKIEERYRTAVKSSNLGSHPDTTRSDSDVLGAMAIAEKRLTGGWVTTGPDGQGYDIPPSPLAVALERLFAGDNRAAHAVVEEMAKMLFSQSWKMDIRISRPGAHDMACAVLAWHRSGTCRHCGGHGYALIPGAPMRSDRPCDECGGEGKIPFDSQFTEGGRHMERAQLARWLLGEIDRAMGRAGPEAMKALAPRLDL